MPPNRRHSISIRLTAALSADTPHAQPSQTLAAARHRPLCFSYCFCARLPRPTERSLCSHLHDTIRVDRRAKQPDSPPLFAALARSLAKHQDTSIADRLPPAAGLQPPTRPSPYPRLTCLLSSPEEPLAASHISPPAAALTLCAALKAL